MEENRYIIETTNSWRYRISDSKWIVSTNLKFDESHIHELQTWLDSMSMIKRWDIIEKLTERYNNEYFLEEIDLSIDDDEEDSEDFAKCEACKDWYFKHEEERIHKENKDFFQWRVYCDKCAWEMIDKRLEELKEKKVPLELVWLDWNAFSLIWAFRKHARRAWWKQEDIALVTKKFTDWNFDELLQNLMSYIKDEIEVEETWKEWISIWRTFDQIKREKIEIDLKKEISFEWIEEKDRPQYFLDQLNKVYSDSDSKSDNIKKIKEEFWNFWSMFKQLAHFNYQTWNWWLLQYLDNWYYCDDRYDTESFCAHEEFIPQELSSIIEDSKENWLLSPWEIENLERLYRVIIDVHFDLDTETTIEIEEWDEDEEDYITEEISNDEYWSIINDGYIRSLEQRLANTVNDWLAFRSLIKYINNKYNNK